MASMEGDMSMQAGLQVLERYLWRDKMQGKEIIKGGALTLTMKV